MSVLLCSCTALMAQHITIKGIIQDENLKTPIPFATVAVLNQDSTIVATTISDTTGKFIISNLTINQLSLKIQFIGYKPFIFTPLLSKDKVISIPPVFLTRTGSQLDEVVVQGEKKNNSLQIDKQIYSAKQFQNATTGTGLDILQRLPSITINSEGEIALRGSTGLQVLINGKPTKRNAVDVFTQIPASNIESIEVISSPSAKYGAEGSAGIINIVTKKEVGMGFGLAGNGMFGGTTPERFGGDISINYNAKKWSTYLSGDYRRFDFNGHRDGVIRTLVNDTLTYAPSSGIRNFREYQYSLTGGASYTPNKNNNINLSLYTGKKESARTANLFYQEYYKTGTGLNLTDNNFTTAPTLFYNHNLFVRTGTFNTVSLDYNHRDGKADLYLLALYEYSILGGPLENTDAPTPHEALFNKEKSNEETPLNAIRLQADYSFPIFKQKLSAGYQFRTIKETGEFDYTRTDALGNVYADPLFNDHVDIRQTIHSSYLQVDGNKGKFNYSIGVRGEYSSRHLVDQLQPHSYKYNAFNLFPSLQGIWNVGKGRKLRIGYNRRIEWPMPRSLSSFKNHRHEETIEIGDPNLLPEIKDIFEVSYNKLSEHFALTITPYVNFVQNRLYRLNDNYSRITLLRVATNAGNATSTGIEVISEIKALPWLRFYLSANGYLLKLKGTVYEVAFLKNGLNYNTSANTTINLTKQLKFQYDFNYTSSTNTAQGNDTHLLLSNVGIKYNLFRNRTTLGLQLNNIFNTDIQTIATHGPLFFSATQYSKYTRALLLSIGFHFNESNKKVKSIRTEYGEKDY
ncbi:TonB-dependent receptor [Chitinophaga filiformis]|uniref:TonB-dependent receptor n=1 Tax=Chitinophaga filiformis TaxID=104663 RepID=A0ABY4I9C5_CHIFI|nr:TonB-dependent receptor [Chitinophaga filiformis]UPK72475.1 TonB-dependent receptor [Chitinophaga filiformis]